MDAPDRSCSIVLVGLQGAGKSTLARGFFGDTHVRLNLDMLRTRHREALLLEACIASKTAFVVDNTNLTREARARYTAAVRERTPLVAVWIDTPLELALARNAQREGKARIPDHVLVHSVRQLEPPSASEGFVRVWRVRPDVERWELVEEGTPP